MHWLEHWRALSARIDGLLEAVGHMTSALGITHHDPYGVTQKFLLPEGDRLSSEIKSFVRTHENSLPDEARKAATEYLAGAGDWRASGNHSADAPARRNR